LGNKKRKDTQTLETNGMEIATLISRVWVRVHIHTVYIQSTTKIKRKMTLKQNYHAGKLFLCSAVLE